VVSPRAPSASHKAVEPSLERILRHSSCTCGAVFHAPRNLQYAGILKEIRALSKPQRSGRSGVVLEKTSSGAEHHGKSADAAVLSSKGAIHGSTSVCRHAGVPLPGLHRTFFVTVCVLSLHTVCSAGFVDPCGACFEFAIDSMSGAPVTRTVCTAARSAESLPWPCLRQSSAILAGKSTSSP